MASICTLSEGWIEGKRRALETQRIIAFNKRLAYDKQPVRCLTCNEPIIYEHRNSCKFCSQRCAAIHTNRGRRIKRHCSECSVELLGQHQKHTCSKDCRKLRRDRCLREKILQGNVCTAVVRKYVLQTMDHKCVLCENKEWLGEKIPLDVDHIDGDPMNNADSNLRLLCKNCHALTPTYGAKNMGKGRAKRRLFYRKNGYS